MHFSATRWIPAVIGVLCLTSVMPANAQEPKWSSGRPDGHAPIGVMGDHTHERGEMMLSYRYMYMDMDGNRTGTSEVTTADVLADYPVSPLSMPMNMSMFGLMYAPSNRVTLSFMLPYLSYSMDHQTGMGGLFTTESSGFSDLKASALIRLFNKDRQAMHVQAGLSFPTGSIDQQDVTPMSMGQAVPLPYPMQLGSGTLDVLLGLTYLGQNDNWSWGVQGSGVIRTGTNDNDYRLGNAGSLTGWYARRWSQWVSTSIRVAGSSWGNIDGADPALNPAVAPTADPSLRGGTRLDALVGLNFEVATGKLKGQRLAVEAGIPFYQDLDGPQLQTKWLIVAGWQYAFRLY
jgi:hypothetical protein